MTSQTEEIDGLKAEAKALNVGGWQACKDPEKLKQKIAEAKAGGTKRSKAPKLNVATVGQNTRNKQIADLEKADPECKYLTQSSSLTASEAAAKGVEIVKRDNGEVLYCGEDIVCRTDREFYDKVQKDKKVKALQSMKSVDKNLTTEGGGSMIQSLTERVKQGSTSSE